MDWTAQIDAYCERLDASFWSEPMNAATNAAFLIAAIILWRNTPARASTRLLCVIVFVIGIGSFLFHTFATEWASLADVVPIGVFILTYLYLVNRTLLTLPWWGALLATLLFVPYAYILLPLVDSLPFFHISDFYWLVPLLLFGYAAWGRWHGHPAAPGLAIGAGILCVSITLRSFDLAWCANWPFGTHFVWHCLNAVMLGWMIWVYSRHMVAGAPAER